MAPDLVLNVLNINLDVAMVQATRVKAGWQRWLQVALAVGISACRGVVRVLRHCRPEPP